MKKEHATQPLFTSSEWTPELIDKVYLEIERVARDTLNLDYYPNQIEIISSEQMVDAYSSVGMPIMYHHWSFGKQFVEDMTHYQRGWKGLAYEIVINSDPCIAYCMEDNTMLMQALVIAHASFGHNSFFKNNYMFKEWTVADHIIEYLQYARQYISDCEKKHGEQAVEQLLDACHSLQNLGVDRYKRPAELTTKQKQAKNDERIAAQQADVNELWETTIPNLHASKDEKTVKRFPERPQENILHFIETNAPLLEPWQREVVRIVRTISQYFYPQRQTSLMNEGWATFIHYTILNELYDEGKMTEAAMLEFLTSHTGVIMQPEYNKNYYSGINVYALGFAMFQDIKRICMEPTDEDREWFPEFAGNGDWLTTCTEAMKNYRDESFITQFLSPKVIRDFKFFVVTDDERDTHLEVTAIHNKHGYQTIRERLSERFRLTTHDPNVQVTNVDISGSRKLTLSHYMNNNRPLHGPSVEKVLHYIQRLWQFDVEIISHNDDGQPVFGYHRDVETGNVSLDTFVDDDDDMCDTAAG